MPRRGQLDHIGLADTTYEETEQNMATRKENEAERTARLEKHLQKFVDSYSRERQVHDRRGKKLDQWKDKIHGLLKDLGKKDWTAKDGGRCQRIVKRTPGFDEAGLLKFLQTELGGQFVSTEVRITVDPEAMDELVEFLKSQHGGKFTKQEEVTEIDYEAMESAAFAGEFDAKLIAPFRTVKVSSYVQYYAPKAKKE